MEYLSSIEKRKYFIREKLKNFGIGTYSFGSEEYNFFMYILNYHPNKDYKIKEGIKTFELKYNTLNKNTFHIDFIRFDNSEDSFSWNTCARLNKSLPNQNIYLNEALRNTIKKDILEYRKIHKIRECVFCNSVENIQVDHITPFKSIVEYYFMNYNVKIPTSFDKDENRMCIFKEEDKDIEKQFYTIHKDMATYQYLCRNCNIKKGCKTDFNIKRRHIQKEYMLNFGKYKGLRINDVPKSYLKWILKNFKETDRTYKEVKKYLHN